MDVFSNIVKRPNESIELGQKMSRASHAFSEAKRANSGTETKSKAISVMKRTISDLKSYAQKQESGFGRFIRKLLNLFGIVTNYQRIMNQIEHLETSAGKLTDDESKHLQKLHKESEKSQKKIGREVKILNKQFTEIEEAIEELKRKAKHLTRVGNDYQEVQQILSVYQSHIRDMKKPLNALSEVYKGDVDHFDHIPVLWERHAAAERELKEIARLLADLIQPRTPSSVDTSRVPSRPTIGGIHNGGNTCYLASALQGMNSAEVYRDLFNPQKNPLKRRSTESESSFKERQLIQRRGSAILKKINRGTNVSTTEINAFRNACYNHKYSAGKRVVKNTYGPLDSVETLNRLLTVLDYEQGQFMFTYEDTITDEEDYEVASSFEPSGKPRKPSDYRTIEEAKSFTKEGEMTFSAYPYLNGSVSMGNLLSNFWKEETINGYLVKHIDEGSGDITYRKYNNVRHKISLDLEKSKIPKVMFVRIQQLEGNKATITSPDVIYPSGATGVGPKYRLVSGIEHMPGHYVAHMMTPTGVVQANDGWVHSDASSSFPGYGYFYVRDED